MFTGRKLRGLNRTHSAAKMKKPFRIARNGVCWPAQDVSRSGLERLAATAALSGLGIGDLEPGAIQFIFEIND